MFEGMGIQWASTLLGCIAVVLVPIPVIFLYYGAKIRARSSFAPTFPPQAQASTEEEGDLTRDEEKIEPQRAAVTGDNAV
jgi:DHA1 family multidrug resistance protein-like MFS transporter